MEPRQEHTATCTGREAPKGPTQGSGTTSMGLPPSAQVEQPEKSWHKDVNPRPGDYSHVHRSNKQKRDGTVTLNNVQGPTAACTVRTARKGPAQERRSTYRGLPPRAQVEQP